MLYKAKASWCKCNTRIIISSTHMFCHKFAKFRRPVVSVCYCSQVCLRRLWLPDALLYPRIRRSAPFRGYAFVGCGYRTRFFTREFDGLLHFAGNLAEASLARLVFLPANSTVCSISRVNKLRSVLPDSFSYPRIRWSAPSPMSISFSVINFLLSRTFFFIIRILQM